jgi:hypothetical protein
MQVFGPLGSRSGSVIICTNPDPSDDKQNNEKLNFYSFVTFNNGSVEKTHEFYLFISYLVVILKASEEKSRIQQTRSRRMLNIDYRKNTYLILHCSVSWTQPQTSSSPCPVGGTVNLPPSLANNPVQVSQRKMT